MPVIKWTAPKRRAFLQNLMTTGNVSEAARASKVSRSHAYALKMSDQNFAAEWADALESATDILEAEARHRAVDGVEQPHFHQGQVTGSVRKYSDSLLMFLLKAHRPEKYRDRTIDPKGTIDDDIDREIEDAKSLLGDRLSKLDTDQEPDGAGDLTE
ncbi:MAG: hypothetical protein O2985_06720 [Proteobacteria bacterium]|nr:hypothetical protein [Pseudomonadota bacterium]